MAYFPGVSPRAGMRGSVGAEGIGNSILQPDSGSPSLPQGAFGDAEFFRDFEFLLQGGRATITG